MSNTVTGTFAFVYEDRFVYHACRLKYGSLTEAILLKDYITQLEDVYLFPLKSFGFKGDVATSKYECLVNSTEETKQETEWAMALDLKDMCVVSLGQYDKAAGPMGRVDLNDSRIKAWSYDDERTRDLMILMSYAKEKNMSFERFFKMLTQNYGVNETECLILDLGEFRD